jgi:hypothetical protein
MNTNTAAITVETPAATGFAARIAGAFADIHRANSRLVEKSMGPVTGKRNA